MSRIFYYLIRNRQDFFGGLSLKGLIFTILIALGFGLSIPFAGVFQWEFGEVIDIHNILPDYAPYYIFGIIGLAIMVACFVKPVLGIFFFTAFLPFRSEDYTIIDISGAEIRIADFFILPAIVGWALNRIFVERKGLKFESTGAETSFLFFFWWCALSMAWTYSKSGTVSKLVQLVYSIIIVFMIIDTIKTKKSLNFIFVGWLIGGILLSAAGIMEKFSEEGRAESVNTSPLETGEYLNYPVLIAFGLFFTLKSKWLKTIVLGSILIFILGSLVSGSRGPLLGMAAGIFFFWIFSKEMKRFSYWAIGAIMFATISAFIMFFIMNLSQRDIIDNFTAPFERFIDLFETQYKPDIGEVYRIAIWQGIWEIFKRNPIFGIGVGALPEILPDYVTKVFQDPTLAHNIYLEVLIAVGPFGFMLFLWFVANIIKIIKPLLRTKDSTLRLISLGLTGALIAQAVGGLTFGLFFENRVLSTTIGMLLAVSIITRNTEKALYELPQRDAEKDKATCY
ncbi:MAG: hypothetical protein A2Y09_10650 [Planctomycetes bacterium GWA2_39_15]|nr:MAG: hypothetical protein A2Y09_10650 [Planctomycetes bacterium GWA2_39_15]